MSANDRTEADGSIGRTPRGHVEPAGITVAPAEQKQFVQRTCWCGGTQARLIGEFKLPSGEKYPWVQCVLCNVQAIYPQPKDAQLAASYSAEYYGASRKKFIGPIAATVGWSQAKRARWAKRCARRGGAVLDIGCGNGGFLMRMAQLGFDVQGTEWSQQSAARVPGGIKVHVGDLLSLDLPDGSLDLITMWHVLEHVRRPHETLQRIHQLLKPGGEAIFELPNAESRQARRFGMHWFHCDPPRHLFGFGVRSLSELLQRTGFEIEATSTHSFDQNTFGFIQSWLNLRCSPRDRLYTMLKGVSHEPLATRLVDATMFAVLFAPAAAISAAEACTGRGATMTILARKSA